MTAWASILVPAGAVVAGTGIGGTLTVYAQRLADRRLNRRERESREHALLVRRLEIERDTVLALQDAIEEHMSLVTANNPMGDPPREPAGEDAKEAEIGLRILKLRSRLMHEGAIVAISDYLRTIRAYKERETSHNMVPAGLAYAEALEALGAAFRYDGPESLQAGTPDG